MADVQTMLNNTMRMLQTEKARKAEEERRKAEDERKNFRRKWGLDYSEKEGAAFRQTFKPEGYEQSSFPHADSLILKQIPEQKEYKFGSAYQDTLGSIEDRIAMGTATPEDLERHRQLKLLGFKPETAKPASPADSLRAMQSERELKTYTALPETTKTRLAEEKVKGKPKTTGKETPETAQDYVDSINKAVRAIGVYAGQPDITLEFLDVAINEGLINKNDPVIRNLYNHIQKLKSDAQKQFQSKTKKKVIEGF